MLCRGHRVRSGRIHNETAVLCGGCEVHVIDPHPGASDDPKPAAGRLEHVAADLRAAAHDQSIAKRDLGAEFLGGEVVGAFHIDFSLEKFHTSVAELLGNQDPRLRVRSSGHRDEARETVAEKRSSVEARRSYQETARERREVAKAEVRIGDGFGGGRHRSWSSEGWHLDKPEDLENGP